MSENKKSRKDPRTEIIPAIWGITVGILALCIPLAAVTDSGLVLPVVAMLGATISSCVVWLTRPPQQASNPELEHSVAELKHRIAQLEIDTRDMELRYSIQQVSRSQQAVGNKE